MRQYFLDLSEPMEMYARRFLIRSVYTEHTYTGCRPQPTQQQRQYVHHITYISTNKRLLFKIFVCVVFLKSIRCLQIFLPH